MNINESRDELRTAASYRLWDEYVWMLAREEWLAGILEAEENAGVEDTARW